MTSGIDAEDVAALCLLVADGDLGIVLSDLGDLLDATERRAHASFGPVPEALRRALGVLVLDAALPTPEEIRREVFDDLLATITLGQLLPPMLSRDRVRFDAAGGARWSAAAPASMASPGARPRARALLALVAAGARPAQVTSTLERLGLDRAFIRVLLDPARAGDDDEDVREQVSYQDWFE